MSLVGKNCRGFFLCVLAQAGCDHGAVDGCVGVGQCEAEVSSALVATGGCVREQSMMCSHQDHG